MRPALDINMYLIIHTQCVVKHSPTNGYKLWKKKMQFINIANRKITN